MIIALLALAAAATDDPRQQLGDCLSRQVERLEASGDAADVIAKAALYRCHDELLKFELSLRSLKDPEIRTNALNSAIARVLEVRVARKSRPAR